jgi:TRAP-type C4-dicarboxylate transport system permease small subunit
VEAENVRSTEMVLEGITILALFAMALSTLIGVADRFVLGSGLPWPEELARFLLIWTSLLSAAVAAKHQAHFRLTFIYGRLGPIWGCIIDGISVGSLLFVAWHGILLVEIFHFQTSPALGIPMSFIYAAVPVSTILMSLYILKDILARLRHAKKVLP